MLLWYVCGLKVGLNHFARFEIRARVRFWGVTRDKCTHHVICVGVFVCFLFCGGLAASLSGALNQYIEHRALIVFFRQNEHIDFDCKVNIWRKKMSTVGIKERDYQ